MNCIAVSNIGSFLPIDPDAPTGSLLWDLSMAVIAQWVVVFALVIKAMRAASQHRRILVSSEAYFYDRRDEPPFSVNAVVGMFLALFFVLIVSALAGSGDQTQTLQVFLTLQAITILVISAIAWRDVLPALQRFGPWYWYLFAAILSVVTFLVSSVWLHLLHTWMNTQIQELSTQVHDMGFDWLTVFLLLAVFTPIVEELAMRGVILGGLQRALSDNEAIVAAALMFAIMHMSVIETPELLVLGLALGFVRVRSGSLWPCFLLHGMHNAFCFAGERWGF
jgi:membrane protease YdiL (CAAX protease family)